MALTCFLSCGYFSKKTFLNSSSENATSWLWSSATICRCHFGKKNRYGKSPSIWEFWLLISNEFFNSRTIIFSCKILLDITLTIYWELKKITYFGLKIWNGHNSANIAQNFYYACFWKWNSRSTSSHVNGITIWALCELRSALLVSCCHKKIMKIQLILNQRDLLHLDSDSSKKKNWIWVFSREKFFIDSFWKDHTKSPEIDLQAIHHNFSSEKFLKNNWF